MISQLQVLNKILQTKDLSIVIMNNLTRDFFFNYKAEFDYIMTHYDSYKCVPDKLTFVGVFPDFDTVEVNEPDSYLIEQLYKDYNTSYLASRFNELKEYLEADQTDKAINFFMKSVEKLRQGGAMSCVNLLTDRSRFEHYTEKLTAPDNYYISTGFDELDKILGGIDCESEDMVISARPGVGKTWILLKMAVAASKQGKTVGIYEGEMTADKIGYRIDTLFSHISNTGMMRGYADISRQYKDYLNYLAGDSSLGAIKVITPNDIAGPPTVQALQAFVEKENIDILFIDQYSLLETTSRHISEHERIADISKDIKKLQVNKRIPIISVSQMNRTKNESGELDTTQIFGSDRIGQDATTLLMLEMKDEHNLVIHIPKARDGGTNKKLIYSVDWNYGTFAYIPQETDSISSEEDFDTLAESYSTRESDDIPWDE